MNTNICFRNVKFWLLGLLLLLLQGCQAQATLVSSVGLERPIQATTVQASASHETPTTAIRTVIPTLDLISLYGKNYQAIQLAWFYKPPTSGDLDSLAQNYSRFILTRMDERERDRLLALGARGPMLQYLLFSEIQNPGSCTELPSHNQVAEQVGDYCDIKNQHPDWFLKDTSGNIMTDKSGYSMMDVGSPGWRDFWLARAQMGQERYGWQGVFLDNVEASLAKRQQDGGIPQKYPDEASYQAAVEDNLRNIYTRYFKPAGRPLFANIISMNDTGVWFRYLQYLDGAMIEDFAVDWNDQYLQPADWQAQMEMVVKAQTLGKEVILVAQGAEFDQRRETFALASYLLVNNGKAFFRYSNDTAYRKNWLYDNDPLILGMPLGPRYQEGANWYRDFEKGRVTVNPALKTASISVKP